MSEKKHKAPQRRFRWLRRLFRSVVALALLFMAFLLSAPLLLRPTIERLLREKIVAATHHLYTVDFQLTSFSILPGRIRLQNLELQPDTSVLQRERPQNYYQLSAGQVEAKGIQVWTYLWNGTWSIRSVKISHARLAIHHDPAGKRVLPGKKTKAFRLLLKKVVFEHVGLEIWNDEKKEKRFTGTLSYGQIGQLRIRKEEPVEFAESELLFTPIEVQTREGHALHLDNVTIRTQRHYVSVHARQVEVNKLADALGDQQHTFFKDQVLTCTVDSLVFSAFDFRQWPALLKRNEQGILIDRVYLHHPVFRYYPGRVVKDNDTLGLDPMADRHSTPFRIGTFEIRGGEFSGFDPSETYPLVQLKRFHVTLDGLRNSPSTFQVPVWADNIKAGADTLQLLLHKKLYAVTATNVSLRCTGPLGQNRNKLEWKNLLLTPTVAPDSFFRHKGFQIDYPVLQVPHTEVVDIDYGELLSHLVIKAGYAALHDPELHLFRDKNHPLNLVKRPPFPPQQLRNIPVPFYLDSMAVKNGIIRYDELAKDSKDTGHFHMDQVFISTHHLTNQPLLLEQLDSLQLDFAGKFYGKGPIDARVTFYMNRTDGLHRVDGHIGSLQAQLLNAITMPSAHLRIRSGVVHGGDFHFIADYERSEGTLLLRFEKLRIALLETRKGSDKLKTNFLKTAVANMFLVKENPAPGQEPVVSLISYRRDPSRWVINYWWKSLLSGIDHIVLARKNKMLEIKKDADELQNLRRNRRERTNTPEN